MNATRAAAARAAASRILRRHAVLAAWLAGAALATASGALYAASVSTPFRVELLFFPFKDVAQCDQTGSGANVQVSCTSPAPGSDQRFMLTLRANRAGCFTTSFSHVRNREPFPPSASAVVSNPIALLRFP